MAFRDGPFENLKVPLAWTAGVAAVVAIVGAVVLMVGDRRGGPVNQSHGPVRAAFDGAAGPVSGVLATPVRWAGSLSDGVRGYFFAVSENQRLKRELAELQPWRDQAIALKNVNARYEAMLGLRTEPPVAMVTARSISDVRGPFVNAKLLDVGSARGVRIGNPVINEHGMVGRVTGSTTNVSRMLLLTDVASRTPVLIDRSDARAILTGDGSGNPRLEFLRTADIQAGDRILSSGDGGGIPRGVPIGVAAKGVDGTWRAKLFSDRGAIDYVRVMLFEDFGQLVSPDALNAAPLASLTAAPPPSASQAAAIGDAAARRAAARAAPPAPVAPRTTPRPQASAPAPDRVGAALAVPPAAQPAQPRPRPYVTATPVPPPPAPGGVQ